MNQIECDQCYLLGYYLCILIPLGGIFFWLSKKYGFKIATISLAVSMGLAFLTLKVIDAYLMADMLQPTDWYQVTYLDNEGQINSLEYKPELGILALTASGEIKVADSIPTCLPDGEVAVNLSSDTYAELTQTPRLEISTFASKVAQQLFFDIEYPVGADELGVSSYLLAENGEVWCSEIYARGGLGGGAAVALGIVCVAVPIAIVVFFISLVVTVSIMRRRSANSASQISKKPDIE